MKKLVVVGLLIFVLSISVLAQRNDDAAGWLECMNIKVEEGADYCEYRTYSEPGFICPDGMHSLCYHCICHFYDAHVVIDTRACECRY